MKVLVATSQTQGQRSDDFSFTLAGELVRWPAVLCDCPDCGCERAMEGLASHKATTTFAVADRTDLEPDDYRRILIDHLLDGGWVVGGPDDPDTAWVREFIERHVAVAAEFEVGDVLEIRNDRIKVRRVSRRSSSPDAPAS
jgi:hypothetical protein